MILTKTPLRVSLFGGGSDYFEFFNKVPGAVLGMAINKFCYVGVKYMPPGQEAAPGVPLRYRVQYSKVDDCSEVEQIKHPAVRAALKHLRVPSDIRLEFHCFSDLPGRSGLGGSSAFAVGVLHALHTLLQQGYRAEDLGGPYERPINHADLAAEAIHLEQQVIRETVGCQDQVFAAYGGLNLITFSRSTPRTVTPLKLDVKRLEELERSLMLVYSGTMRDAHVMAAKQVAQINSKMTTLVKMVGMAHVGANILADPKRSLTEIGDMLNEAWRLKCELCPEVTSPAIHALYRKGLSLGALGGKLLGAGGGGFLLFFVPPDHQDRFVRGIEAPCVHVRMSPQGSQVIINEETP